LPLYLSLAGGNAGEAAGRGLSPLPTASRAGGRDPVTTTLAKEAPMARPRDPRGDVAVRDHELGHVVDAILEALRTLRFGAIQIVVHDGRVVQIERTEKVRLERDESR
jgi:hypothetical protein